MSEDMKFAIALFCGFVIFVFFFIKSYLKGKSLKQRFVEKAEADGYVTEGVCIKTRRSLGTEKSGGFRAFKYDTLIVTYEYFVNRKSYYKKINYESPGSVSIDFPYKVAVYFDPKKT